MRKTFIILSLSTLFLLIIFSDNRAIAGSEVGFFQWLGEFRQKAYAQGISKDTVDKAFDGIEYKEKVVSLDKKQPEKTIMFAGYKKKIIPQFRADQARKKLNENYALLDRIEKEFGVQKRFIVALWAIESDFGRRMGGFNIPHALASLAYEGRRREFFEKELMYALKILQEGHVAADNFLGSWAGAMGQCQFMPSSFIDRAVDYDGDGRKDIWGTKADVFASIANYLAQTGWEYDYTWGRRVKLTQNVPDNLWGRDVTKPMSFWKQMGVKKEDGSALPDADIQASLIDPDGDDGDKREVYLVYKNYKNIMKWNRSSYFATSVGLLADKLR